MRAKIQIVRKREIDLCVKENEERESYALKYACLFSCVGEEERSRQDRKR